MSTQINLTDVFCQSITILIVSQSITFFTATSKSYTSSVGFTSISSQLIINKYHNIIMITIIHIIFFINRMVIVKTIYHYLYCLKLQLKIWISTIFINF